MTHVSGLPISDRSRTPLRLAGAASLAIALLHVTIVFVGPAGYRYFGAGERLARLSERGSALPALITLGFGLVFAVWGGYALSASGLGPRLPLLRTGLAAITAIYLLRGLPVFPGLAMLARHSSRAHAHFVAFSGAALLIGLTHLAGVWWSWKRLGTR